MGTSRRLSINIDALDTDSTMPIGSLAAEIAARKQRIADADLRATQKEAERIARRAAQPKEEVPTMAQGVAASEAVKKEACELYATGKTLRQVASELGIARSVAIRAAHEAGIIRPRQGGKQPRWTQDDARAACALVIDEGWTLTAAMAKHNIPQGTAHRLLQRECARRGIEVPLLKRATQAREAPPVPPTEAEAPAEDARPVGVPAGASESASAGAPVAHCPQCAQPMVRSFPGPDGGAPVCVMCWTGDVQTASRRADEWTAIRNDPRILDALAFPLPPVDSPDVVRVPQSLLGSWVETPPDAEPVQTASRRAALVEQARAVAGIRPLSHWETATQALCNITLREFFLEWDEERQDAVAGLFAVVRAEVAARAVQA